MKIHKIENDKFAFQVFENGFQHGEIQSFSQDASFNLNLLVFLA